MQEYSLNEVLSKIDFGNEEKLSDLYKNVAYSVVKIVKNEGKKSISTTQFRKFYDKVLEINEKAKRVDDDKFNLKIKPLLSLMYSKVEYAVTRGNAGFNFKKIMFKCLDKVNSKDELERFKYFLEAVMGFMPKK